MMDALRQFNVALEKIGSITTRRAPVMTEKWCCYKRCTFNKIPAGWGRVEHNTATYSQLLVT